MQQRHKVHKLNFSLLLPHFGANYRFFFSFFKLFI
jgi:hypothetical protein